MLEWYAALPDDQKAMLQGLVVMALLALVRAVAHWAGKPLSETAGAKLGNYLTVAVATGLTTLLSTGATAGFWLSWMMALFTAVGTWEGLSKFYKPLKVSATTAIDRATEGLYFWTLVIAGLALFGLLAFTPGAALADEPEEPPQWELSGLEQLGFDAGGGCLSYRLDELGDTDRYVWLDGGIISWHDRPQTDGFLGASTNVPWLGRSLEKRTRWGGGVMFPDWALFGYIRSVVFSW